MAILKMDGITKGFPGVVANDNVCFEVRRGEIHALVGENGAGKSTLIKILTGLYAPDKGEILLRGEAARIDTPRAAIKKGIGVVHQHFMLINRFDATQNIILGEEQARAGIVNFRKEKAKVRELCRKFDFQVDLDKPVEQLSVGQQQRIEIVKVLYRGAEIIVLDEPTAVLTPKEVAELFVNLRKLKDEGKTIIFISHKLHEVLEISDRITVLRRGKTVSTVDAGSMTRGELAELMVGRPVVTKKNATLPQLRDEVLALDRVTVAANNGKPLLDAVTLSVRGGEIYGIAGVEGNGQRELVEAVMGLTRVNSGSVAINGNSIAGESVASIRARGVGFIPEDRHARACVLPMRVWENAVLGRQDDNRFARPWKALNKKIREYARKIVMDYDVRLGTIENTFKNLSGGNQQKVILARELQMADSLVVAAQPVRGLDIGAIEFVHDCLLQARGSGKAVLLISADIEEVLSLSDRVGIMFNGKIVKEFKPGELDTGLISAYMLGAECGGAND